MEDLTLHDLVKLCCAWKTWLVILSVSSPCCIFRALYRWSLLSNEPFLVHSFGRQCDLIQILEPLDFSTFPKNEQLLIQKNRLWSPGSCFHYETCFFMLECSQWVTWDDPFRWILPCFYNRPWHWTMEWYMLCTLTELTHVDGVIFDRSSWS